MLSQPEFDPCRDGLGCVKGMGKLTQSQRGQIEAYVNLCARRRQNYIDNPRQSIHEFLPNVPIRGARRSVQVTGWWTNHAHIRFIDDAGVEQTEQVSCTWLAKYRIPPDPSPAEMASWAVSRLGKKRERQEAN